MIATEFPQPPQSCVFSYFLPSIPANPHLSLSDRFLSLVSQFPYMPPSSKSPSLFFSCPGFPLFFPSSLFPASFT